MGNAQWLLNVKAELAGQLMTPVKLDIQCETQHTVQDYVCCASWLARL
jgi:hypothetical protein